MGLRGCIAEPDYLLLISVMRCRITKPCREVPARRETSLPHADRAGVHALSSSGAPEGPLRRGKLAVDTKPCCGSPVNRGGFGLRDRRLVVRLPFWRSLYAALPQPWSS